MPPPEPLTGWMSPMPKGRYPTLGPKVIRFIESNLVHGEGDFYGAPFRLAWWQKDLINRLFALRPDPAAGVDENGRPLRYRRQYRKALLGLPKGNGKTELVGALALASLCLEELAGVSPLIPVAAASKAQANLCYGSARIMAEESPTLPNVLEAGAEQITVKGRRGAGRMYRVAAVDGTNDGQRPSLYIADEFHEWDDTKRVDQILANGTAKRAESLELKITTAGSNLDTACGRLYERGVKVAKGEIEDPEFFFYWLEPIEALTMSPEEWAKRREDRDVWRRVNPAADDFWPLENLERRLADLLKDNPPAVAWASFERYFLNRWVAAGEGSWLEGGLLEACQAGAGEAAEFDPREPIYVGWDASTQFDSTAVVAVQRREIAGRSRIVVKSRLWERPWDHVENAPLANWRPPIKAEVVPYIWELAEKYTIGSIQFDPAFVTWEAAELEAEGLPMALFAQNGEKMVIGSQTLYASIRSGELLYGRDPEALAWERHLLGAAARPVTSGNAAFKLVKGRAKRPMDAAIASAMAIWGLAHPGKGEQPREISIAFADI